MKKQVLIIFLLMTGILNGMPVVASTANDQVTAISELQKSDADTGEITDSDPAEDNHSKSVDQNFADAEASDTNENDATAPAPEAQNEPDIFAADPFAGTSLARMKFRLNSLENIYFSIQETADLGEAVVAAVSDNRFFRRNCEFLSRIARKHPFPTIAAMLIFPELSGIANELLAAEVRSMLNMPTGEQQPPLLRLQQLERLTLLLELSKKIASQQRHVYDKIENMDRQLAQVIKRRNISGAPAEMLKKYHAELSQLATPFKFRLSGLINQYDHQLTLLSEQLNYLRDSAETIPTARFSAQLAQAMRGVRDFRTTLEKYHSSVADLPAKVNELKTGLHNQLKALSQRNNRVKARVSDFVGHFPDRDIDLENVPKISLAEELQTIFSLLQKISLLAKEQPENQTTPRNTQKENSPEQELLNILIKFIDSNPWQRQTDDQQN